MRFSGVSFLRRMYVSVNSQVGQICRFGLLGLFGRFGRFGRGGWVVARLGGQAVRKCWRGANLCAGLARAFAPRSVYRPGGGGRVAARPQPPKRAVNSTPLTVPSPYFIGESVAFAHYSGHLLENTALFRARIRRDILGHCRRFLFECRD